MKPLLALQISLLMAGAVSADDSARIAALLAPATEHGGVVTIPPGDYHLDGAAPLAISSNTTVFAHGARFILPETLPEKALLVLFAGENISHFSWHGGEFIGHVFDPARKDNTWEPNANTKGIEITTTREGGTHDILFRDVQSNGMAAAVIGVHGLYEKDAVYGPVIVRDNIFVLGDSAPDETVTFAPNGSDIQFSGNTFRGKPATIVVDPSCKNALVDQNQGAATVSKPVNFDHGQR